MQLSAGMQKKQWVVQPADPARQAQLARELKVSALLAQVLINRGVTDASSGGVFLRPKLSELISPERMPGAETAARRIIQAVRNNEKITIYGDYDVDGIAAVAILCQLLRLLGADVDYYIPHRIEEGYGLNEEAVRLLADQKTAKKGLLVTVDCGITALSSAALADQLSLDLVITDHHQVGPELPKACAIVHPALDETYPNQDSSGSMVAYKLAWLIASRFSGGSRLGPQLRKFMLDATTLAAMGTIADVMDIRGENRILTSYGLKSLSQCGLCGIQALIDSAGLAGCGLNSFHIGYRLAPMLNAAGRMGHARLAVDLLNSDSQIRSVKIAEYLKQQNNQRRQFERRIFSQACEKIVELGLNHPDRKSIVLASQDWHSGVIGIVASRIVEKFYRPTIMISISDATAQGSGRSIAGFDMLGAISACSRHLVDFGGHKMAAGITIQNDRIEQFTADFEDYARQNLSEEDVVARLHIDAAARLGDFSRQTVGELELLSPFGQGNPRPVFVTEGVRLGTAPKKVGAKGEHLQLVITDNVNSVRCVGFGMGKLEKKLLERDFFDIAYEPQINSFNGSDNVEFVLTDVRF